MTREIREPQNILINHFVDHLYNRQNIAGWGSMGIGKCGATLISLDRLDLMGVDPYPALILAPPRVARNTWTEEVGLWPDHLQGVSVAAAVGNAEERKAALRRGCNLTTLNYENIAWLVEHVGYDNWPFKTVVADEATALKNMRVFFQKHPQSGTEFLNGQGSKRAKALAEMVFKHNNMVIELSGTPSPNGLKNLYGQLFLLDKGYRLGRSYKSFTDRWFRNNPYNHHALEPLPFAQAEIESRVVDICRSLHARDYYPIGDFSTIPIYVDLPPTAMKQYKEMERKLFTQVKGHEIEAFNAASKTNKCSQLANGAAYIGEDDGSDTRPFVEVHDVKIQALHSVIEEANGMPVMVVYFFRSDLARLKKHFPHAVVLDKKKSTEDAFNAGKIDMLIVPYSASHGLNLQHGTNICAIFGMTWDLETYMQVIERIGPTRQWQSGYERPVFVYQILARNTIDEDMRDRQLSKKSVQDSLLEAAKKRG